jgi:hypothetical protein
VIARTWFRRVALCSAEPEILTAIRYLECDPEIAASPVEDLTFCIERCRSHYRIVRDGELLREQISPQGVIESLHAELMFLSLADFPLAPLLHAASLRRGGRRLLLVGPKGSGKTILALQLIYEGYEFEGDENVFVTIDGVVPRPRCLRVKESAVTFLPNLATILDAAPYYQGPPGPRTYNLDPRAAGARSWRIEQGKVDAVVLLRANHGGYSSVRPLPSLEVVREVMQECALPETGRAAAVGAIAKTIGGAKGFDLSLGDLSGAVACLDQLSQGLN